jgi:hypothetical protein
MKNYRLIYTGENAEADIAGMVANLIDFGTFTVEKVEDKIIYLVDLNQKPPYNNRGTLATQVGDMTNWKINSKYSFGREERRDEYHILRDIMKDPANKDLYEEYKICLLQRVEDWREEIARAQTEYATRPELRDSVIQRSETQIARYQEKHDFLVAVGANDMETMKKIASNLNPNWLAVVSNMEINNCGKFDPVYDAKQRKWWDQSQDSHPEETYEEYVANHAQNFRMDFVCHKKWAEMKPTENNMVRFCEECSKNVFYARDIMHARELASQGSCIGVDVGLDRRENDHHGEYAVFGRPTAAHTEANRLRALPDLVSSKRIVKRAELHMEGKLDNHWQQDDVYRS